MPRINVEDRWFCDPRRDMLKEKIGLLADAVALSIWKIAQEYYRLETFIPEELFNAIPHSHAFLEVGLAEKRAYGIYIKGSKELFDWIHLRKEAGKRGGLAKSSKVKQNLAKPSKSLQTLPSSSSSSSKKEDGEKEEETVSEKAMLAFYQKFGKDFVNDNLPLVLTEIEEGNASFSDKPKIVRIRQMLQAQYNYSLKTKTKNKEAGDNHDLTPVDV